MENVIKYLNNFCFGCGVCVVACKHQALSLHLNSNGFYMPKANNLKCNECGLCVKVCSFINKDIVKRPTVINSYAIWSNDSKVRYKCSSGGASFEIGKYLINNGYNVCAVKYNAYLNRAEHYIASNEDELKYSIGSKYIQSYTSSNSYHSCHHLVSNG